MNLRSGLHKQKDTTMINVDEYQKKFENYFLTKGFTKLSEPVDTDSVWYIAMKSDNDIDFDMNFWLPAMQEMLRALTEAKIKTFYHLDVYYLDDILVVTATLGNNPRPQIKT